MKISDCAALVLVVALVPGGELYASSSTHHTSAQDAKILASCPVGGKTKDPEIQKQNKLKRRMTTPSSSEIDASVTLDALLASGDDTNRWNSNEGATITGYVVDVKPGGPETVNCKTQNAKYT